MTDLPDTLHERIARGDARDDKQTELARLVFRYQRTLRPCVDELPAAAAIEPVDDNGEPADMDVLHDALAALDEIADELGFYPDPPAAT